MADLKYTQFNQGVLFNGDCLELMKDIPDKSINLIVIDPPYNISKAEWDKIPNYIEWMGNIFKELERVLKDNGSFYFFHNDFLQIVELQNWLNKNSKFIFKQLIVWNKRFEGVKNKGFLDGFVETNQLRNYQKMAEYCLFYTFQDDKDDLYCFKQYLDYMTHQKILLDWNYKNFNNYLGYKSISNHWFLNDGEQKQPRFISEKDYVKLQKTGFFQKTYESLRQEYESLRYVYNNQKTHHSVWNYEIAPKIGHRTPKPVELIENIIRHSSNEKDVILDCFAGSGTTAIACINTNRTFICMEKEEKYYEISKKRIEERLKETK
jgi:site-specific DNA-methyltransferase (adenine-specific)